MKSKSLFTFFLGVILATAGAFAQAMEVTSTGVGIGTSTPRDLLEIYGGSSAATLRFANTSVANDFVRAATSGNLELGTYYGHAVGIFTSNTERIRVDSSGNVGLGTTSPSNDLTVLQKTDTQSTGGLRMYRANGTSSVAFFQGGDDNTYLFNWGGGFKFYANGSDALTISTGGNLGVGSASPSIAGGFTPRLHVKGPYGAIALEATTPGVKWGFGVDSNGALDIFESTSAYGGRLLITNAGNVGIGNASPSYKLHVNGSVRASSFISDTTTYADFVFKPGYQLASLPEVEAAIQKNGHLPGIPSEAEAKAHGIDLAAMQVKLLQKVEELTLHLIAHEKTLSAQQQELRRLSEENAALQRKIYDLNPR